MIYFGTHLCYSLCHNIFDGSLYEVDSIMKNFKDAQKRTHILSYPILCRPMGRYLGGAASLYFYGKKQPANGRGAY